MGMLRRDFIRATVLGSAAMIALGPRLRARTEAEEAFPSRRDRMLAWLEGKLPAGYTPAAFFVHFGRENRFGPSAVSRHLEYFGATGMDFVKIQYEREYPREASIVRPSDWSRLRTKTLEFFEPQLDVVRRIVAARKREALVIVTLYSPFMCAGHCTSRKTVLAHMEEDPDAVRRGLDTIVEGQLAFVKACIDAGVDGFYMATQGGEKGALSRPELFTGIIKASDLAPMREAQNRCAFNVLHVCDDNAPYASYDAFADYPGHVVSCCPVLADSTLTWRQISDGFRRPGMGGMERRGLIAKGSIPQIQAEARRVIAAAPQRFILGADCTVPGDTDWARIRAAISAAHGAA